MPKHRIVVRPHTVNRQKHILGGVIFFATLKGVLLNPHHPAYVIDLSIICLAKHTCTAPLTLEFKLCHLE